MKTKRFWIASVIVTLILAGFVSLFASASPDGLESVLLTGCETADGEITGGACVLQAAGDHEIGGVFADYGMSFLDNEILGASLAGILGVVLTLVLATGFFWLLARGRKREA
ncbi:PDGLE domain-containing protein [Glycomyces sp. NPDC048151]|uniref:PDGLE domain-containing protein n=1 Tax=Glycomyces sp. NPDC048151 TaxID=3364002 RepID=UPI003720A815